MEEEEKEKEEEEEEYPKLKVDATEVEETNGDEQTTILPEGTDQYYQCLAFSPDGHMLAAQGGEADLTLCVWDWENETPLLRCKNVPHEIHGLAFSQYLAGRLTTYGVKLKYESGKFGAMGISDIDGCVQLPDGQVMSGCESLKPFIVIVIIIIFIVAIITFIIIVAISFIIVVAIITFVIVVDTIIIKPAMG
nr:hypothetical protein BaRGS_028474 [Batillaria attramentaria]